MPTKTRKKTTRKSASKRKRATKSKSPQRMMKAAAIDRFGPPEVLTIHEFPIPKAGPKDVLIALHSAGVGIWDSEIRKGEYTIGRKKFPLVLGADGAGVIAGVGRDVRSFHLGDQVWAYHFSNTKSGFYAEYIAVNTKYVAPVPSGLSLLEAGAEGVESEPVV